MTLTEFLHTAYGVRLLFDFLMMSVAGGVFILPLYTLLQEREAARIPLARDRRQQCVQRDLYGDRSSGRDGPPPCGS